MNVDMFIFKTTVFYKILSCFALLILACSCACIGDRTAACMIAKNKAIAYVCGMYNKVPHELEHEFYIQTMVTDSHEITVSFFNRELKPYANSLMTAPAQLGGYPAYFTVTVNKDGRIVHTYMCDK